MWHGNAFGRICLCLPVCNTVTFETLHLENSFLVYEYIFRIFWFIFISQGHQIRVNVTGAKKREIFSHHPFCYKHGAVTTSPFQSYSV